MKRTALSVLNLVVAFGLLGLLSLTTPGCGLVDSLDGNPALVRIAATQAVVRYVERGGEHEAAKRQQEVLAVLTATLYFIDGDTRANARTVVQVFSDQVDWDSLSKADQLLAVEVLLLVQDALERRIAAGELSGQTVLYLRGIVVWAIDAARYL